MRTFIFVLILVSACGKNRSSGKDNKVVNVPCRSMSGYCQNVVYNGLTLQCPVSNEFAYQSRQAQAVNRYGTIQCDHQYNLRNY